ncbi:MAG TPA: aminopeptidase [Burkholderiales bacterium]|nr:aminopeptidase [Burkholderiales bacterium]
MTESIHNPRPTIHVLAAASFALLASACSNVGYYAQTVSGQLNIWGRERPIEEVIADPNSPQVLKERLARVTEIRDFASRELALPDNRSYKSYVDLERPFVVWNVFAAPEFSVQPMQWCLLFAGCVSYRGYFSKEEAERFASTLAGNDVYIGGVPAYSTLGYFDDPVLNTFINYPPYEVARLLFHELAHQVAYAKDDSVFNESFAVTVEQEGLRRWLAKNGDERQRESVERAQRVRGEFIGMIERYRGRLAALYRTRIAPDAMREKKREILAEFAAEYQTKRKSAEWGGFAGYDRFFAISPNNAQLASVAIYTRLVPQFEALLAREGGDLGRFYAAVKELAALPKDERYAQLGAPSAPAGNESQRR